MHVELEVVPPHAAPIMENLMELYCHDLSVCFGLQVGPDGRFGYPNLPLYWAEPERRFPFFIRADTRLAGFALAMRGSPASPDPSVFDVAEFFVLRTYRRSGVGASAACALWSRFKGPWTVRAAASNPPAVGFWRQTVRAYAAGRPTAEHTTPLGNVVRHVFTLDSSVPPPAPCP